MTLDLPHEGVTYKVIGAAMRVHNALGPGLRETNYHRALSAAMQEAGLSFESEKAIRLEMDDAFVGLLYIDHFVEDSVVVETKVLSHLLTKEEIAQVITYLAVTEAKVGLLLNFGRSKLEYKRILPPKKFADWRSRARRYVWQPAEVREDAGPAENNPFIRSESVVYSGSVT